MTSYTLDDLMRFDPDSFLTGGGARRRFLCPVCGGDKSREDRHRCLDVDLVKGVFVCHRGGCGARGRLNVPLPMAGRSFEKPAPAPIVPKMKLQERLRLSHIEAIAGTRGEKYLLKRGITSETMWACHVKFAKCWFGSPAVMFAVRFYGVPVPPLVAVQGRFIVQRDLKTQSYGSIKRGVFATPGAFDGKSLAITEAPIDAMTLMQLGHPAVAMCGGAIPDWLPRMCRTRLVYLAFDADDAGEKYCEAWRRKLHGSPVERLAPPDGFKDWNGYATRGKF